MGLTSLPLAQMSSRNKAERMAMPNPTMKSGKTDIRLLSIDADAAPCRYAACKNSFHPDRPPYHHLLKKCRTADRPIESDKILVRYPGRIDARVGQHDQRISR